MKKINVSISLYFRIGLVLFMFLIAIMFYDMMPSMMPIHWDINGKPDSYATKTFALLLVPVLNLSMLILFEFIPYLDPRKNKYKTFSDAWENLKNYIIGFFLYLYIVMIFLSVTPNLTINFFIGLGIGVFFILIGRVLGKIKSNYFVGIRTPWTLENEEVWNKTHKLSGWTFILGGIIISLSSFFGKSLGRIFFLVIILIIFIPFLYSYLEYKKTKQ